jgi:hypothetical protein
VLNQSQENPIEVQITASIVSMACSLFFVICSMREDAWIKSAQLSIATTVHSKQSKLQCMYRKDINMKEPKEDASIKIEPYIAKGLVFVPNKQTFALSSHSQ